MGALQVIYAKEGPSLRRGVLGVHKGGIVAGGYVDDARC